MLAWLGPVFWMQSKRRCIHCVLHTHPRRRTRLDLEWAALGGYLIGLTGAPYVPCPKMHCSVCMHARVMCVCASVCARGRMYHVRACARAFTHMHARECAYTDALLACLHTRASCLVSLPHALAMRCAQTTVCTQLENAVCVKQKPEGALRAYTD